MIVIFIELLYNGYAAQLNCGILFFTDILIKISKVRILTCTVKNVDH